MDHEALWVAAAILIAAADEADGRSGAYAVRRCRLTPPPNHAGRSSHEGPGRVREVRGEQMAEEKPLADEALEGRLPRRGLG